MKWQIKQFDTVSSTNEIAKSLPAESVVIAKSQTGGHGRYGRIWKSPKGNLYLSAVVADLGDKTPLMSFVAGVSVIEALSDFPVSLKWPNDILLNGGKVAGILLEKTDIQTVVIGIGVNVVVAPTHGMMYQTACLENKISLHDLTEKILSALADNILLLANNQFNIIREKWIRHACGLGKIIEVHLAHQTIRGLFKEFSPQGELILETPDKIIHKITAGDVFLI
ncbi:MAG: biotin--[acetyl-CoA-carboxylase] ligase [Pseudomonadota bacterium]|nr:biotin--[acetyl-CoA-carboxylase] ligase [Pseudomonadota bacterium]